MADWISRLALLVLLCLVAFGITGFARFANHVTASATLPGEFTPDDVDGIVALTGGKDRIASALRLLEEGKAKRLLISGVHPKTSPDAIIRTLGASQTTFDCCVDIDRLALDTIGNAEQTADWVNRNGFSSIIVVTSNYHMPRSLMEMKRLMPGKTLTAFPVSYTPLEEKNWYSNPHTLKIVLTEYIKFLAASVRTGFGSGDPDTRIAKMD